MRRKAILLVAVAALLICGAAYAASTNNTYSATYGAKAAGSASKPAATALVEKLKVTPPSSSDRGGYPVKTIVSKIADLKAPNGNMFPKCSAAEINGSSKWNGACSSGSLVASGKITSQVGSSTSLSASGFACNLIVDVYNAGAGKVTYFLYPSTSSDCGGLTKGAAAAFTGTVKESGTTLVNTVDEPADVSTEAGNLSGEWGSLQTENLNWKKMTVKKGGKSYPFIESIGCKAGKRSSSTKFTATNGKSDVSATVTSSSAC